MPEAPPRVFISYSHDSPEHQDRVLALADRLRADGIDASIDQYEQSPSEGWSAWCEAEIRKADFVLMVCTETYRQQIESEDQPGIGYGVLWEARLIRMRLYEADWVSNKFIPVLLADAIPDHIPPMIRGATYYRVEIPENYEAVYRLLTNQPILRAPTLGVLRRLAPRIRGRSESNSTAPQPQDRIPRNYKIALNWVEELRRNRGDIEHNPTCFVSYSWGDREHETWVEEMADHLQEAGIAVIFDRWHNRPGTRMDRFIERIQRADFVCVIGTPSYLQKDQVQDAAPVAQAELALINQRLMSREEIRDTVIPVLRQGTADHSFPSLLRGSVSIDFRKDGEYFFNLLDLVFALHRIPLDQHSAARRHLRALRDECASDGRSSAKFDRS
jgi:hypothetical protein